MIDNWLPEAIIGRLSRVRTLESQLVDRLEELRTDRRWPAVAAVYSSLDRPLHER